MVVVVALTSTVAVVAARRAALDTVAELRATGPVWADGHRAAHVGVSGCAGALVVSASAVHAEPVFALLAWATMFFSLVDLDTHSVPTLHARTATVAAFALLAGTSPWTGASPVNMVGGAAVATVATRVVAVLSRGDLGAGDVTLAPLVGVHAGWMAWSGALVALAVAFVLSGVVAAIGVVTGRLRGRSHIPLAPFLFAGTWIAVLR